MNGWELRILWLSVCPSPQAPELKPPGIAEAFGEGFGRPVGLCEDPVDFAGEGAVEDAGVVCADREVDV